MKIDVENIAKNKNTYWRPIYEVIQDSFFAETKTFPPIVLELCGKIQMRLISYHLKSKYLWKKMAMEQGLYAQVVIIRQKD